MVRRLKVINLMAVSCDFVKILHIIFATEGSVPVLHIFVRNVEFLQWKEMFMFEQLVGVFIFFNN